MAGLLADARGRRLDILAGAGLDRDRLRAWGVAHALAWGWYETSGRSPDSVAAAWAILAA
ncbi:MAG TPA: hypothetical protein VHF67_13410 [Gaiellaceae bacterium]|nr:hypothetical protein [Gaiellaceae bacterium]